MEEFFKFWRQLPKFFLGFLLVVNIAVIALGRDKLYNLIITRLPLIDWEAIGNFASGVLIFVSLAVLSSFGLLLLDIVIDLVAIAVEKLQGIGSARNTRRKLGLDELLAPLPELIEMQIAKNGSALFEYTLLKNQSMGENLNPNAIEQLESYMSRARAYTDNAQGNLIQLLNYYSAFTQEQRKIERFEGEIRELYYIIIVEFSLTFALLRAGASQYAAFLFFILFITLLVFLPLIRKRKTWLAEFILAGYIEVFVVGVDATSSMEDREY